MIDWNDLRFFLAVARTGSTVGAARTIGVNQTTVARRIAELEQSVGGPLFERGQSGYRLLPAAVALVQIAERVEAETEAFASLAGAMSRGPERIRVTTNEPLANTILAPAIRAFRGAHPKVTIDLVITARQLDLARGEADVALRAAPKPTDPELVTRRLGDAHWGAYFTEDYARSHGAPRSVVDLAGHTILLCHDASGTRLAELAPDATAELRDTLNELVVAARAGLGVASLPCVLGDSLPDFVRGFIQDEPATPVWLVYHERLRGAAEVRAFLDFVVEHTFAARDLLRGSITPVAA